MQNYYFLILAASLIATIVGAFLGYFLASKRYQNSVGKLDELAQQQQVWQGRLKSTQDELWTLSDRLNKEKQEAQISIDKYKKVQEQAGNKRKQLQEQIAVKQAQFDTLDAQTKALQQMQAECQKIEHAYATLPQKQQKIDDIGNKLQDIKSELSLYSQLDEFVSYGIYPLPKYGDVNSAVYSERIKQNREQQKQHIKNNTAYTAPSDIDITGNTTYDKQLLKGQGRLLITAFNSECDYIISKINSKNFEAIMTRIEKLAEHLEKQLLSLEIGINLSYIELKMQECVLYYQYVQQKEKEADEQRQIRALMKEEALAQREIERAIKEAEREEQLLQQAMEVARLELQNATQEQKQFYELQILELSQKLAQAQNKEQRALSMAQQTKQGHVYIISNIGSFGEDVYKIGMTRRLDPLDRVRELSDASVPFSFDVHAMIFSENAPELEKQLHDYFADFAVNKINQRKEFFYISLADIRAYIESRGINARWTMVADATEYRQSLTIADELNT